MNIDAQPIAQTHANTRRRRLLGVTAGSAAALAGIVLAGRGGAIARADEDQALVGSWMVAAIPREHSLGLRGYWSALLAMAWPCARRHCNKRRRLHWARTRCSSAQRTARGRGWTMAGSA